MKKARDLKGYKCCVCGAKILDYGNNPYPVVDDEDARCCDQCNMEYVIPARIAMIIQEREKELQ